MQNLTGADGELIERLMSIVDDDPDGHEFWWLDVSGIVADAIGGCADIVPQSTRPATGGVVHWEHQGNREVVARVTWMNRLRLRLAELVGQGMAEDFLVASLRIHVGARLREGGPVPVAAARTRYDAWIAEQATGAENLELSLIARAIMTPPSGDTGSEPTGPAQRWATVATAVDEDTIGAWRTARTIAAAAS